MSARISVITATLNRCDLLRRAIESTLAQGEGGVQHIVIDGLSTDGTLEMLERYPHLEIVSEKDSGLYEAWNKGIARATGDLVCILNSDDEIPSDAFARARAAFAKQPDLELLSGPVELCFDNETGLQSTRIIDDPRIISLREQDIGPGIPITNGRYFAPALMRRAGPFDARYKLVADREFLLRIILEKPRHVVLDYPLYRYHSHEGSLTLKGADMSHAISKECFDAALNGFDMARTPTTRAAYARWLAWATLYLATIEARRGSRAKAMTMISSATKRDPGWFFRTVLPIARHVREKAARRGRLVDNPGRAQAAHANFEV